MPTLSLCLHVRNEESRLGRALESFRGIADEIVVVDTGSTDATVRVAHDFGAKVLEFPWTDSFSDVRNFMFGQASGDWIFHLDADEALLPESARAVLGHIERDDVQGAYVLRQDLADENRLDQFTEMRQLRLYRREGLPKLRGRCHPQFDPSLESIAPSQGRSVVGSEIRIRHWGYLSHLKWSKLERGVRLMRMELAERPGQLYYLAELSRTLYALQDPEAPRVFADAVAALEPFRNDPIPPGSQALLILETMLSDAVPSLPEGWSEAQVSELGDRWFPRSAPLHWQLARRAFLRENFGEAKAHLEFVRELAERGNYDRSISFSPSILSDELWLNLGVCRMHMGDLTGAEMCFQKVSADSEFVDEAARNRYLIRNKG